MLTQAQGVRYAWSHKRLTALHAAAQTAQASPPPSATALAPQLTHDLLMLRQALGAQLTPTTSVEQLVCLRHLYQRVATSMRLSHAPALALLDNLESLPSVPFESRAQLPPIAAVYIVHNAAGVHYVGSTKNLRQRWYNHDRQNALAALVRPLSIAWVDLSHAPHTRSAYEQWAIGLLQPHLNAGAARSPQPSRRREDVHTSFAGTLRRLRHKQGLSQRALAAVLGCTHVAIVQYENGRSMPSMSHAQALAQILGVSLTVLIDGERFNAAPSPPIAEDAADA